MNALSGSINGQNYDHVSCGVRYAEMIIRGICEASTISMFNFGLISRSYYVSPYEVNKWSNALWICTTLGKGLVLWEDIVTYNDMKSIASSDVFDKPIWTALNNKDKENCDGASKCDGKLVINY